jgi:hypothetical protein
LAKKGTIAAIVGIIVTIVVGLVGTIAGEALSPLGESLKDFLSPPPDTNITSAKVFNAGNATNNTKVVQSGAVTSSPSITFQFEALKANNRKEIENGARFECSLDGSPFEPCLSPKAYGDLAPELSHMFQVRAKGLLGNTDNRPDNFTITTITSSLVEGVFKNKEDVVPNTLVSIDNKINKTTDARGGFFFDNVGRGSHILQVYLNSLKLPYYILFPIPQGIHEKDLGVLSVNNISKINATPQVVNASQVQNKSEINPQYKAVPQTMRAKNYTVDLLQEGKQLDENTFFIKVSLKATNETFSNIRNVTYFLHPTFTPSVITSNSFEDKFAISFTGWGVFNLKAKVYFKDGQVKDLTLPMDKWTINL